ncbi:MAG TPA: twin-arginine translocation signal domain-containing protein [Acidimicrobiales bacterium]|nr:twin-arginine translocation signal domain-containing protein [Acidimicrobiales bacterium]
MADRLSVPRRGLVVPAAVTRRGFLAGAAAAGLLAACGGDDDDTSAGPTSSEPSADGEIVGGLSAVRFYGPYYRAGQAARVPFGLSDDEGLLPVDLAPEELGVTVRGPDGEEAASGLTAPLYEGGLPRPYYAFEFRPETAGFYDIVLDTGSQGEVVTQVQIVEADDEVASAMVGPGDPLPALQTPTTADARGVTPICTREPACDLHVRTAAEVVAAGEPMALLVATPAFCQTVICGPVLDVLLGVLPDVPGVTAVHAEVFSDPEDNSVPPTPEDYAPVIDELGLAFEPVLYTVGADGIVRQRLDYIFGEVEIRRALEDLVA